MGFQRPQYSHQQRSTETTTVPPQEIEMHREFTASSPLARSASVLAALVSTVLIVSGIVGLAGHYSGATQIAAVANAAFRG
jgi:hypothetical protein